MSPSRLNQLLTRPRRGATLVFVALLLTVIIGISAVAIDLSRLYVGVNELQTAVDAAALRGALALQNGTTNPTGAVTAFLEARNPVMGTYLSPLNIKVEARRYDANNNWIATTFTATGSAAANAVRVIADQPTSLLFGLAVNLPSFSPRRAATARIASIGLTCVKPWMFEAVRVVGRHVANAEDPPSEANYAAMRSDALTKNGTPIGRVHIVLAPPTEASPSTAVYGSSLAGKWIGVELPSQNASNRGYQKTINTCNAEAIVPPYPDLLNAQAEQGSNQSVVNVATNNAFNPNDAICTSKANDTCQALVPVILGRPHQAPVFGDAGPYDVLYQTTFQLVCLKRRKKPSYACPSAAGIIDWTNESVLEGTMFGYLNITRPVFSGSAPVSFGGSIGTTSQRLLLVE